MIILVLLLAMAYGGIVEEFSPDGDWFRLYNSGEEAYYCYVEAPGGPYGRMMYPGQRTPWYRLEGYTAWECEG
jgi:hypothetical protein